MAYRSICPVLVLGLALLLLDGSPASAQQANSHRPAFTPEGTVQVPAFELPPSPYMSREAVETTLKARAGTQRSSPLAGTSIQEIRAFVEHDLAGQVAESERRYAVDVVPQEIAGVKTRIFTPKAGEANSRRVLINLHGGAWSVCADACAKLESIPIAAVGRFKVVSVDYRMGPENVFPAATEDVVAVYRELLKTYRPENIGIFGCSSDGGLTAQVEATLQDKKIPTPGVLGIFGSGAVPPRTGDSAYLAAYVDGMFDPPKPNDPPPGGGYLKNVNIDDPLAWPARHPEVLAKFPPTLMISGTRASDLSLAAYTHTALMKAGVKGDLIVGEGMPHCHIYRSDLPESRDAYDLIVKFFNENLGVKRKPM